MRFRSALVGLLVGTAIWPLGCARTAPPPPPPVSATTAPVNPDPRVGAVFLGASDMHTCTGAVLHSSTGDLILTAAHCLASDWPTTFVPGFNNAAEPANTWNVGAVYLDQRWLANQDPHADFAIARVSRAEGGTVESVIGTGLTVGSAPAKGTVVEVSAYPLGSGGSPIGCRASTGITPGGFPSLPCSGLVDGTSGAPWRAASAVVGVIGGLDGGGCEDDVSYSSPFDSHVVDLLHRAEAGGPGDSAPDLSEGEC